MSGAYNYLDMEGAAHEQDERRQDAAEESRDWRNPYSHPRTMTLAQAEHWRQTGRLIARDYLRGLAAKQPLSPAGMRRLAELEALTAGETETLTAGETETLIANAGATR